jgi:Fem-1 family protein b
MPSAIENSTDPYQINTENDNPEMMNPNSPVIARIRGKRKNNEDSNVEREEMDIRRRVHQIVRSINPRTFPNDDTLLHLACMRGNTLKSATLFGENNGQNPAFFPSPSVVKLLVECGSKINADNQTGSTPLHTASMIENFNQEIVEILLDNGAHIDIRNTASDRPVDMLKKIPDGARTKINPLHYTTLKCLAARAVANHGVPYKEEIPSMLEEFIQAH